MEDAEGKIAFTTADASGLGMAKASFPDESPKPIHDKRPVLPLNSVLPR